jgi:hypothetical protein
MTTKADWIALAERCEKAPGPNREIDAAIMFDAFAKPVGAMSDGGPRGYLWPDDNPSWNFGMRFPGKDRNWFNQNRSKDEKETLLLERDGALVLMNDLRIPCLTSSIDAIVGLIEREFPGFSWRSKSRAFFDGSIFKTAKIWHENQRGPTLNGEASTVSLALCAAFCRAMDHKERT